MAYTTISKCTTHYETKLYSGDGGTQTITGLNHQPDMTLVKSRNTTDGWTIQDAVRGFGQTTKLATYDNSGQNDSGGGSYGNYGYQSAATTDGFTMVAGSTPGQNNKSGNNYCSWNWLAGGTAPTKTYRVVVVNDGGNKYRFRNSANTATFGSSAIVLNLQEGGTYTFDVSDSTMNSHPFVLGTASGTDGSYSTGVTYKLDGATKTYSQYTSGFSSATTRQLIITVAASAPTLYYNCSAHSGMGAAINTNSTFGSSNFDGTIHSTVSANTTAGFSISTYTGNNTAGAIVGHDLGNTPKFVMIKRLDTSGSWITKTGASTDGYFYLHTNAAITSSSGWLPTSSTTFTLANQWTAYNASGGTYVAYSFAEIPGYSSIGSYTGNASTNGTFVYTGFRPSFILTKTTGTDNWRVLDDKRKGYNPNNDLLQPSITQADSEQTWHDIVSNGFKLRTTDSGDNGSGVEYIYMAFGQTIVGTNNVPATAR